MKTIGLPYNALALLPLLSITAFADEKRTIGVEELSGVLQSNQTLQMTLKTGGYAEGQLQSIGEEALEIRIWKSDLPNARPGKSLRLPLKDLATVSAAQYRGNKRTKLPLILCSTLGTLAFVAAGATEENKSTYLPLAAGFTVALGGGSCYLGRSLDRHTITYVLK